MCDTASRVGAGGEGSQGAGIEHVLIKAQRQQNKLFSRQAIAWSLLTNLCCYLLFLKIIGLRLKLIKLSAHLFPSCLLLINNKAEILNFISWYEEKKERICLSTGDTSTALHHHPTNTQLCCRRNTLNQLSPQLSRHGKWHVSLLSKIHTCQVNRVGINFRGQPAYLYILLHH